MKCSQLLSVKVSLIVTVLVYLAITAHCDKYKFKKGKYILTIGQIQPNQIVLFNETIIREISLTRPRVSLDVLYPTNSKGLDVAITYIEIKNKDEGGYAQVKAGGVGNEYVEIHLESHDGKGFEFQIIIYGYNYD